MKHKKTLAAVAVVVLLSCGTVAVCYWVCCDRIVFIVLNHTGSPLKNVEVMLNETARAAGDINADGHGRVTVRTIPECSPRLKYQIGEVAYDTDLDTYVCGGMREIIRITVKTDGLDVEEDWLDNYVRTVPAKPESAKTK